MTTYIGSNGADSITSAADLIYARKGDDTVEATNPVAATVNGGEGNDLLIYAAGPPAHGWLNGNDGADTLVTHSDASTLIGGAGADSLVGGPGNDVLDGGRGADTLDGGASENGFRNDNTASYAHAAGPVRVDLLDPSHNSGEAAGDQYRNIGNLIGSAYNDTLSGDTVEGGGGRDLITAFTSSYEHAAAGVRVDAADPAHNTGDAAGDVLVHVQAIIGSNFADTISGYWQVDGRGGDDLIRGGPGSDALTGGDGADTLIGGDQGDGLDGGAGDDSLVGGAAHDFLIAGSGHDTLIAGAGNDLLQTEDGGDVLNGGPGSDTVWYLGTSGDTHLRADLSNPATNAGAAAGDTYVSIENLIGTPFGDILKGDNSANSLFGGDGNDQLIGLGGSDYLAGGNGDDTLQGQGGHDTLDGGTGHDVLSGGAGGRDLFLFNHDVSGEIDNPQFNAVITDFEDGVDQITIRDYFAADDHDPVFVPLAFSDLNIVQQGSDVLITEKSRPDDWSILVLNQSAANFTSADFI